MAADPPRDVPRIEGDPGPPRRASRPAPRPSTAAVRDVTFPLAFRGYEREAVDAYVMQVNQLIAELEATRSPEAAIKRALDSVGEETSSILQHARETADDITARSRVQADDRLQAAEREAQAVRADAEARLREIDADTDAVWQERARLIEDVRRLATELSRLADVAAERMAPAEELAAPQPEGVETEPTTELAAGDLEPEGLPEPALDPVARAMPEDEEQESPEEESPEAFRPAPERAGESPERQDGSAEPENGSPAPPPDPRAAQAPRQQAR
jgi:DivIVA domain-containing protein